MSIECTNSYGEGKKEKVAKKKCTDSTKFSYWKNSYQILIAQLKEEDANRHTLSTLRTINADSSSWGVYLNTTSTTLLIIEYLKFIV